MKTTVSIYDFREAFRTANRSNFSYEGLEVLFDYLEAYEEDTGEELELDVIALCCDYTESTWQDIANDYSIDLSEAELVDDDQEDYDEQCKQLVTDYLTEHTMVVGETSSGSIIYQSF